MALHASHSIRRSRVCPVHVYVSLRASVAGERQELPMGLRKPHCSQNIAWDTVSFLMLDNNGWSYLLINNKNTGHVVLHVHVYATGNTWRSMLVWLCNTLRSVCIVDCTRFSDCAAAAAAAAKTREYSLINVHSHVLRTNTGQRLALNCS